MRKSGFNFLALLLISALLVCCASGGSPKAQHEKTITIGAKLQLTAASLAEATGTITWSSSNSNVASVDQNGVVTALAFTETAIGRGRAVITASAGGRSESFNITTTMEGEVNMMELPPMKDQFSEYFAFGNIFNPGDTGGGKITNERLTRHFNFLTAENDMKPDKINPSRGTYNYTTADRMVNAAIESGFKVVGHTLLWHSQIPSWQAALRTDSTSPEDTLRYMKEYITAVMTHFRGRIHTWDVINEIFPDGGYNASSDWKDVMRKDANGNPWYMKIGSDVVYEAFLAARLADPQSILYYNDFNLDQRNKATMVRDMVRDVNARYKQAFPRETRLLIEGIGMQSHHNTGVPALRIRNSLAMFRELGVRISISELDVLSQTWGEFSPNRNTPTFNGKLMAANLYGEYFGVFLENADIIERVTFWGVFDEQSWRRTALPLIFEGRSQSFAKPAYYRIMAALENHRNRS